MVETRHVATGGTGRQLPSQIFILIVQTNFTYKCVWYYFLCGGKKSQYGLIYLPCHIFLLNYSTLLFNFHLGYAGIHFTGTQKLNY